jgi:nicotinate-nucleotide--dimethylbenzimidazole phosphoribosyltransferase
MSEDANASVLEPEAIARFGEDARRAVYDAIALRRDVRHFVKGAPVDEETLGRILGAAHQAPSVGFSQPWAFVVVRDGGVRDAIRESFLRCREAEAARYPEDRRARYLSYRLEGIVESALNVCVVVDLRPREEAILGTTVQPEAVRASACCAVQNLWLAARAEGIGVGWVSIVEPAVLRRALGLPPGIEPVGYLCVGQAVAFRARPMLEELGWRPRRALAQVVHRDRWGEGGVVPGSTGEGANSSACGRSGPPAPSAPGNDPNSSACGRSGAWAPGANPAPHPIPPVAIPPVAIMPVDEGVRAAARAHQALLTKPIGSLGKLEEAATWYAAARGAFPVERPSRGALALFMADHGVVVEGISAYGSQVTASMACNLMAGGAAANVLARRHGVELVAVDVGIAGDMSAAPTTPAIPLVHARVRAGTGNLRLEPAMLVHETRAAMEVGARIAAGVFERGARVAVVGEIGIGNTTAAAALTTVFTGTPPEETCGRGTGIDDATLARKIAVVREGLRLHAPRPEAPIEALAAVGGLEIAAIAGFLMGAASLRLPVILDGFVTNAAALVAQALDPAVVGYLLASHASAERGARIALGRLGLTPLLALDMRLGEGTGGLMALELLRSAVALQSEMATFATAGVVRGAG